MTPRCSTHLQRSQRNSHTRKRHAQQSAHRQPMRDTRFHRSRRCTRTPARKRPNNARAEPRRSQGLNSRRTRCRTGLARSPDSFRTLGTDCRSSCSRREPLRSTSCRARNRRIRTRANGYLGRPEGAPYTSPLLCIEGDSSTRARRIHPREGIAEHPPAEARRARSRQSRYRYRRLLLRHPARPHSNRCKR